MHNPPLNPEKPALHAQAVEVVLCKGELERDGQLSQSEDPVLDLYLPTPHFLHVHPSGPEDPALHVQAVTAMLCAGELESAGQLSQATTTLLDEGMLLDAHVTTTFFTS